jgi:hypothetical protein
MSLFMSLFISRNPRMLVQGVTRHVPSLKELAARAVAEGQPENSVAEETQAHERLVRLKDSIPPDIYSLLQEHAWVGNGKLFGVARCEVCGFYVYAFLGDYLEPTDPKTKANAKGLAKANAKGLAKANAKGLAKANAKGKAKVKVDVSIAPIWVCVYCRFRDNYYYDQLDHRWHPVESK